MRHACWPRPALHCHALVCTCREQSLEYGAKIYTETVNTVDMQHGTPFRLLTDSKEVMADALIIATGAAAKRLKIPGADEETGFWNKGISACAVCDGSSPLFRWAGGLVGRQQRQRQGDGQTQSS